MPPERPTAQRRSSRRCAHLAGTLSREWISYRVYDIADGAVTGARPDGEHFTGFLVFTCTVCGGIFRFHQDAAPGWLLRLTGAAVHFDAGPTPDPDPAL